MKQGSKPKKTTSLSLPPKKGTERNDRKLLDNQVSFDLKVFWSFLLKVRTTGLYSIINSYTGKNYSVPFT